jgi:periplasmic copper chaperone A
MSSSASPLVRSLFALTLALPTLAAAHVEISSGPAAANVTQVVTFGVGHGCAGVDTYAVKIDIPAGVTSVRPLQSPFGKVSVEKDLAGVVTAVIWQKADGDLEAGDPNFYSLSLRLKTPNAPFTTLYFPTHQTCKIPGGATSTSEWVAVPGGTGEPAPFLRVVPARKPGWNKNTVPTAMDTAALTAYFADAVIVWKGTQAFSANSETATQIPNTEGVTPLTELAANDDIWVRY